MRGDAALPDAEDGLARGTPHLGSRSTEPPSRSWRFNVANNCADETAATALRPSDRLLLVYVEEPRQG